MNRAEHGARAMVTAVIDRCATTGEDVRSALRSFRRHVEHGQAITDDLRHDMGKQPDTEALRITRLIVGEVDKALLELDRPKAEA